MAKPGLDVASGLLRLADFAFDLAYELFRDPDLRDALLEDQPLDEWMAMFEEVRASINESRFSLIEYIEFEKE